jgi:benzodiazapine receptor
MKNIVRQIAVIVSVVVTLVVNALANALPLNGQNTGQISDQFKVYFVPAGYVFAIWGLIYVGLIAYAIFQVLPSQRENPLLQATGWWIVLSGIANSIWIFLWHFNQFPLTVVAMLVLLVSLRITYVKLGVNRTQVSTGEKWAVHLPFSIYLGWITVATIANISDVLYYVNWNRFGLSPELWMSFILGVVVLIAALMNFLRHDIAYAAVLLWALFGITVRQAGTPVVTPTQIAFVLVVLTLVAAPGLPTSNRSKLTKAK